MQLVSLKKSNVEGTWDYLVALRDFENKYTSLLYIDPQLLGSKYQERDKRKEKPYPISFPSSYPSQP
jgi:hypothetical protein